MGAWKKIFQHLPKLWLPYLIAIIGSIVSILLWYLFWEETQDFFELLTDIKKYFHWVVLFLGIVISILLAVIIGVTQLARQRYRSIHEVNKNLKKETHDRITAEKTKQKLEVALLQGQKLQAMGTLAGGIAHDFNNILYAIIGYVELARDEIEKDSQIYKNLGSVLEAANRGQELVSRILAFSRRQQHQFDVIDLKSTIEAILALLRPAIPASTIIDFTAHADSAILMDQTQIHQVLVNIINNAVDAMDGEGTITIRMDHISSDDVFLRQFSQTRGRNYCKIEITDTGHGMDQHTMGRIFEPFFTTKEVGKGTGLGLSIVHSIIKDHEGEITVTSQLGRGTTFMILLPEYSQQLGC